MPIYTKTGDTGKTSVYGGGRVLKCTELIDVYGSVDELNCWIGLVSVSLKEDESVYAFLSDIQSDLLTIGSYLAGAPVETRGLAARTKKTEDLIDEMEKDLPKLTHFILPGGTTLGARLHLARAVCRRVERQTVHLAQTKTVEPSVLAYLNRLSDMLFVLARFVNHNKGAEDRVWKNSI